MWKASRKNIFAIEMAVKFKIDTLSTFHQHVVRIQQGHVLHNLFDVCGVENARSANLHSEIPAFIKKDSVPEVMSSY